VNPTGPTEETILSTPAVAPLSPSSTERLDGPMSAIGHRISPTRREIASVCSDAVYHLGLSRSVGLIFGVIYSSPTPLTFAEVMASLDLSKGSVSQGLHFLRGLGAIKLAPMQDDRRERYSPETELRALMAGALRARVQVPLEAGERRLEGIERQLAASNEEHREFLAQRLDSLRVWHRKALYFLPLLQRVLGSRILR
jgi:HTH-type transcriptional regulator, glycine betaine synthesis regulator